MAERKSRERYHSETGPSQRSRRGDRESRPSRPRRGSENQSGNQKSYLKKLEDLERERDPMLTFEFLNSTEDEFDSVIATEKLPIHETRSLVYILTHSHFQLESIETTCDINSIYGRIIDTQFIQTNLIKLISITFNDLMREGADYRDQARCIGLLIRIVSLIRTLLNKFPSESENLSDCIFSINDNIELPQFQQIFSPSDIESFKDLYQQLARHAKPRTAEKKRHEIKSNLEPVLCLSDSNNYGDHFRSIPIYPTYHEIRNPSNTTLRALVKEGEYENQETYLDIHFKLLREDMVYPLKLAIKNLLELDLNFGLQLHTYDNVKLRKITANHTHGIVYMISFTSHGIKNKKDYDWTRSTRLKFGALLCISQKNKHGYPNFQDPLWAVVTHSDEKEIKETGLISIKFKSGFEPKFKFDTDYFMIESREVYFEAYCHVLTVLQEIEITKTLPFQPILLGKVNRCPPPAYIDHETMLDFSALIQSPSSSTQPFRALALDTKNWPVSDVLNESQSRAVKLAFTSELALIQGPPGTGKSYVGLVIVKIFLRTRKYELKASPYDVLLDESICQRPIFVITQTNHAVDQFLEHIMAEETNVIRIGSRSESELVKTRTLYEVKKQAFEDSECPDKIRQLRRQFGEIRRQLQNLQKVIEQYTADLKETKDISREDLKRVASDHHYRSMYTTQRQGYTTVMNQSTHMSEVWLKQLGVQTSLSKKLLPSQDEIPIEKNPFAIIAGLDLTIPDDKEIADKFKIVETRLEYLGLEGEIKSEDLGLEATPAENNAKANIANAGAATSLVDALDSDDDDDYKSLPEFDDSTLYETKKGSATKEGIATVQLAKEKKITLKEASDKLKQALDNLETETYVSQAVLDSTNIWKLCQEDRELLHKYWLERKVLTLGLVIKSYADKYLSKCKELEAVSSEVDLYYLKSAAVIAMTTTGAAKNAKLLRKLEPRIIIVEEAAEVLEAHIIASLSQHVEHLIMIGDHEQLRPSNAAYQLAKVYNLNLSLFERLIGNGVHHVTLDCQHRMRPEISNIMRIIYPKLKDHSKVTKYERIRGVTRNLYFIAHNNLEDQLKEDSTSRSNAHEAKFVIKLALYLLKQGYKPSDITLLTFYNGQKFLLQDLLKMESEDLKINIATIDKYQGEENEIVILSVVRGNEENYIGHCCVDNRVCVAFSRARNGFFVIGNMERLRIASKKTKSNRWNKILDRFREDNCLGTALPLCCERHDKNITNVANGEDFAKVRDGGCSLKCETILPCSHQCPLLCHPGEHINIQCEEKCSKLFPCTHRCPGKCTQDCSQFKCRVVIEKQAPCGHLIRGACSLSESEFLDIPCTVKCPITLLCGHPCVGSCEVCTETAHAPCREKCPKKLICGNDCKHICHFPSECPPCAEPCSRNCYHSTCFYLCGDICAPCTEECTRTCEHVSRTWKCNVTSNPQLCVQKCKLKLPCGHGCIGLCGDVCPPICRVCDPDNDLFQIYFGDEMEEDSSFITLPDCGHIFESDGIREHLKTFVENNSLIELSCPRCPIRISTCVRLHGMARKITSDIDRNKFDVRENTRQKTLIKFNNFAALLEASPSNAISVRFLSKMAVFLGHIRNSNSYRLYVLDEILSVLTGLCSKEYTPELWCEDSPLTQLILNEFLNFFFDDECPSHPPQEKIKFPELKRQYRNCPIYAMFKLADKYSLSSKLRGDFKLLKSKYDDIINSPTPESILTQCEVLLTKLREKYDLPLPKCFTLPIEHVRLDEKPCLVVSKKVERSFGKHEVEPDTLALAKISDESPHKITSEDEWV